MKVYLKNISEFSPERLALSLTADEIEHFQQIGNLQERQRRAAARCLCREAIVEYFGVPAKEIVIALGAFGKPEARLYNQKVFFNVSHSAEWLLCAVGESENGVDIERIREYNKKIAIRVLAQNELCNVESAADKAAEFTKFWVMKEAYFKAVGTGLSGNEKLVTFICDGDRVLCSDKRAKIELLQAPEGYCAAVCSISPQ